eukprot:TRINITY_DN28435_c0_g1_i1.p1 TRINITY_DN28435_c0_g1~~TRINITY_DN28435_c0_g1_i1.p1  ORF type:complete len:156 (-),score=8.58 TRINITY_DN28435_c0_g1_i1:182-649(-)
MDSAPHRSSSALQINMFPITYQIERNMRMIIHKHPVTQFCARVMSHRESPDFHTSRKMYTAIRMKTEVITPLMMNHLSRSEELHVAPLALLASTHSACGVSARFVQVPFPYEVAPNTNGHNPNIPKATEYATTINGMYLAFFDSLAAGSALFSTS